MFQKIKLITWNWTKISFIIKNGNWHQYFELIKVFKAYVQKIISRRNMYARILSIILRLMISCNKCTHTYKALYSFIHSYIGQL